MRKKELTFEDFQKLAKKKSITLPEKVGFPTSYREGYYDAIMEDIFAKLPFDKEKNKIILDIGCGCDVLTHKMIDICKKHYFRKDK